MSLDFDNEVSGSNIRQQAWVEDRPLVTSRIPKPQIETLSPSNKSKKFDYTSFVKRQLASIFSEDKSLRNSS